MEQSPVKLYAILRMGDHWYVDRLGASMAEPWGQEGRLELARMRAEQRIEDDLFNAMRRG